MSARVNRASFIAVTTIGLLVVGLGLLVVGCGSGRSHTQTQARRVTRTSVSPAPRLDPRAPLPTPGPTGVPAATSDVNVIRSWADALRHGDVRSAAGYFALPSVMVNGSVTNGQALVITIDTRVQAEAANATLPCGARLISAEQRGRYVNALFRLTGRSGLGGTDCGGGGATARTNFVIAHGQIVEWIRAPDDPGDNGTPQVPQPAPAPGSGPTV